MSISIFWINDIPLAPFFFKPIIVEFGVMLSELSYLDLSVLMLRVALFVSLKDSDVCVCVFI